MIIFGEPQAREALPSRRGSVSLVRAFGAMRNLNVLLRMARTSLDKRKIKILLLEGVHGSAVEAFRKDGYTDIEYHPKTLPETKLAAAIRDAYVIGIRSATHLTAGIFEGARRLIGVGCFCIGTNQVDLDAAQAHGIPVFNAPFSNTRSVAELVLAEIIMLLRGVPYRNAMWAQAAVR